jgi:2-aminoadipate transaminase
MSSFSKILAPALRLGWLHADQKVLKPFMESGQLDSSGGFNPVIQGIVHTAITKGMQKEHTAWSRNKLSERADVLMKALKTSLPDSCSFEVPQGGYFLIVRCPEGTDTVKLNEFCMSKHKVQFLPGAGFGQAMKNYFRLSCSYYEAEGVKIGAERLGQALREFLADPEGCSLPDAKKAKLW